MLYVSYHGGSDGRNKVDLIDEKDFVEKNVLEPGTVKLDELRALAWAPNGDLWVVNGARSASQVLSFEGTAGEHGKHAFIAAVASGEELPAISHPFDVAFSPGGDEWFVSNQDTNVVVGPMAKPPKRAPYLAEKYPDGHFLHGTFVASERDDLAKPKTTSVPQEQGLAAWPATGRVQHSVRGLAHDGARLYVADEARNAVKGYDASTGEHLWQFDTQGPVHLLLDGGHLLVGSGDQVLRVDIAKARAVKSTDVESVSGIALGNDGTMYAAERKHNRIVAGTEGTKLEQYGPDLKDNPEFVLLAKAG
jgi:DNA-binding beta-propeller fold protein YncE